jgi:hypothetical protein
MRIGPARPPQAVGGSRLSSHPRKGADMTDKSPRKTNAKKPSKSIKEKRLEKKEKETRKGLMG